MSWLQTAAIAIVALCLAVAALTLALSVGRYLLDRRRETIRRKLVPELFTRLEREDPDWDDWYDAHTRLERYVIRRVVAQYLRRLRGRERKQLLALARAAGIDDRADRWLDSRLPGRRLRGLVWLSLLEQPVSTERLRETCTDRPSTRAAAARLLLTCGGPTAPEDGSSLLLSHPDERLSVFGLDTLFRLNRPDAEALTTTLTIDGHRWDEALLLQTLLVLSHCRFDRQPSLFEWLAALLEHDSPQLRAAALAVFARLGYDRAARSHVDLESVLADPEPAVRIACYDLLGRWRDPQSLEWLRYAVVTDPNVRCRLTAARTLVRRDAALPSVTAADEATTESEAGPAAVIEWARAESEPLRRVAVGWS